jgi:hypothetical protein
VSEENGQSGSIEDVMMTTLRESLNRVDTAVSDMRAAEAATDKKLKALTGQWIMLQGGWVTQISARSIKEIALSRAYARDFRHGTAGHNRLMLIAQLADLLDTFEEALAGCLHENNVTAVSGNEESNG